MAHGARFSPEDNAELLGLADGDLITATPSATSSAPEAPSSPTAPSGSTPSAPAAPAAPSSPPAAAQASATSLATPVPSDNITLLVRGPGPKETWFSIGPTTRLLQLFMRLYEMNGFPFDEHDPRFFLTFGDVDLHTDDTLDSLKNCGVFISDGDVLQATLL